MFCHIGIECDVSGKAGSQMMCDNITELYDTHTHNCVNLTTIPTYLENCTSSTTLPDVCASNPCANSGTCMQGQSQLSYTCDCTKQYHGMHCQIGELSKSDMMFISNL